MLNAEKLDHRITISLYGEQRDAILTIRQLDDFRECSFSEIARMLIDAGLEAKGYTKDLLKGGKAIIV